MGRGKSRSQNRAYSRYGDISRDLYLRWKSAVSLLTFSPCSVFFLRKPIAKRREVDFYQVNTKSNYNRFFYTRDVKTGEMPRKETRYRLFAYTYFSLPFACSPFPSTVRFEIAAWQIYDKPLSITARIGLNQLRDLFFRWLTSGNR